MKPTTTSYLAATTLLMICAAGCAIDDDPDLSVDEQGLVSGNRLSGNRLSGNGLRLAAVGGARIGTASGNTVTANPAVVADLMSTDGGREVLAYAVKCAFSSSQTLVATYAGTTYSYPGEVGIAPSWSSRGLSHDEQTWMTACLMARTNYWGISVPISIRGDFSALATTSTEVTAYSVQEGAFFGNLFVSPPVFGTCQGAGILNRTPSAWLALRLCATAVPGTATTACGFVAAGNCRDICALDPKGYEDCRLGAVTYGKAITVYLMP